MGSGLARCVVDGRYHLRGLQNSVCHSKKQSCFSHSCGKCILGLGDHSFEMHISMRGNEFFLPLSSTVTSIVLQNQLHLSCQALGFHATVSQVLEGQKQSVGYREQEGRGDSEGRERGDRGQPGGQRAGSCGGGL